MPQSCHGRCKNRTARSIAQSLLSFIFAGLLPVVLFDQEVFKQYLKFCKIFGLNLNEYKYFSPTLTGGGRGAVT